MLKQQPIKYCFFMTGNEPWIRLAKEMHDEGIATPILWLGDDVHYEEAKKIFGKSVVRALDFVHRPFLLDEYNYNSELVDFFDSKTYLKIKDACLKMMDRLDLLGSFSRIDREAYFHRLLIWSLRFFYEHKPNVMVAIEKPHSHAQYLFFELARYLGIKTIHFKDCSFLPVNFLQNENGSYVKVAQDKDAKICEKFDAKIDLYVDKIILSNSSNAVYSPHYMKKQFSDSKLISRFINFFKKGLKTELRNFLSDGKLIFNRDYSPINPYRFLYLRRFLIKSRRKKNLLKAFKKEIEKVDLARSYIYFPLHYEPERTTNPDGEDFQDQFKALVYLRSIFPKNIKIIIKEHPSQFLMAERGSRGRSPLFYKLIKNVDGVELVDTHMDSFKLIRNSIGVATITGSVALEAAILGKKSIVFGQAWYTGCPNTFLWSDLSSKAEFESLDIASTEEIRSYLKDLIRNYGVPMINNGGQLEAYRREWYDESFEESQIFHMKSTLRRVFDDI